MKFGAAFLQSKVARQVLALFVLSALIPVAFFSVFSYRQVTRLLAEQTQRELVMFSSSYGSAAYERLLLADRTLGNLVSELARGLSSESLVKLSNPVIQSLVKVAPSGNHQVAFGADFVPMKLGETELLKLRRGQTLLLKTAVRDGGAHGIGVARLINVAEPDGGWFVAEVGPDFLWGAKDELPYMTHICVQDAQRVLLYCSNPNLQQAIQNVMINTSVRGDRVPPTLRVGSEVHLVAMREVFVASRFGEQYWTVIASRPESEALAPVSAFRLIFWGSVILSALVVMLLSVSQIRRTLIPLESLMAATRRVAKRDFSTPVVATRKDEFGELANTFNYMTNRLGQQFNVLSALSRIDRSILSDLNVENVINEVLVHLPVVAKSSFSAIFVLQHDSDRNGELSVAANVVNRQNKASIAISNAVRKILLMNPEGHWADETTAALLYQAFTLSEQDARKLFILPVMWKDRLCGALLLGWHDQVLFQEEDVSHVRDFADRVGVVLYSSERELRLYHQARYDELTDLPNRFLLMELLTRELESGQSTQPRVAILFIALNRFKHVNDTMGHSAGNALIWEAGTRLRNLINEGDVLARFGGHEFVILLKTADEKHVEVVALNVIQVLAQRFVIQSLESFITASVGIAIYPNGGKNAADLLRNADTACAQAGGQQNLVFFTESMNQQAVQRSELERELRQAIEQQQFLLYYQPKTDLQTGTIVGVEALIRWQHPQRGLVNPGTFITLAEETGLIVEMGQFALTEGCRQFSDWRVRGIHLQQIAINVSSRQFRSGDVLDDVRENMMNFYLQAGDLELEVTESLMVDNFDDVTRILKSLRESGVSIALDDFGTGYSSMSYLEILPFDTLKIDMSFIRRIKDDGEGGAIASAIIAMAHSLHKKVVAEGVETQAQVNFLKQLGCHIAQGYFYGRPLPAAEFEVLYRQQEHLRAQE